MVVDAIFQRINPDINSFGMTLCARFRVELCFGFNVSDSPNIFNMKGIL